MLNLMAGELVGLLSPSEREKSEGVWADRRTGCRVSDLQIAGWAKATALDAQSQCARCKATDDATKKPECGPRIGSWAGSLE